MNRPAVAGSKERPLLPSDAESESFTKRPHFQISNKRESFNWKLWVSSGWPTPAKSVVKIPSAQTNHTAVLTHGLNFSLLSWNTRKALVIAAFLNAGVKTRDLRRGLRTNE